MGNSRDYYKGREQSFLKHQVLRQYMQGWAMKVASQWDTIWFVDAFSGPWGAQSPTLEDTSIAIGLGALLDAKRHYGGKGRPIRVGALFVEKDQKAYAQLKDYLASQSGAVETRAFLGEFASYVAPISRTLGDAPSLIFIDPKGWKGAELRHIAPVVRGGRKDVIVNVMANFIGRFAHHPERHIRDQIARFFNVGPEDMPPPGTGPDGLFNFYREQLKRVARLKYSADLAIPHPTSDRTWFRLVVGAQHHKALELFRQTEAKVVGKEAGWVRAQAKRIAKEQRTGQFTLNLEAVNDADRLYLKVHERDERRIRPYFQKALREGAPRKFLELWPPFLEGHHVTLQDVRTALRAMERDGQLVVHRRTSTRTIKDDDQLQLPPIA